MTDTLSITRQKQGKAFVYNHGNDVVNAQTKSWIESLVIPPAWQDVHISTSKRAKILATGFDQAGRQQYVYNPSFRAKQEKLKFDRMLRFATALPKLRRQIAQDLTRKRLDERKVVACAVKLIDQEYFRVGNEQYAAANKSYGITTMRSKHVDVSGHTVVFDFIGKSGKHHVKQITDKQIARIVKQLDELPGYEIFRYQDKKKQMHDIGSAQVNAYIKQVMGEEFTAKDFRTWGGTLVAATLILAAETGLSKKEQQKLVTGVVKDVATKLGNTPAVARNSYIDPRVIAMYGNDKELTRVKKAIDTIKPKKYMNKDEQCLLRILQTIQ